MPLTIATKSLRENWKSESSKTQEREEIGKIESKFVHIKVSDMPTKTKFAKHVFNLIPDDTNKYHFGRKTGIFKKTHDGFKIAGMDGIYYYFNMKQPKKRDNNQEIIWIESYKREENGIEVPWDRRHHKGSLQFTKDEYKKFEKFYKTI